ncbi:radical SAM protein [Candidatus Pelagibacter sp.]|nr:radical SAM protein [Candidatus Pelagibacter sp.]
MSINQDYEILALTDKIGHCIRIRSLNKAKHFAVYRTFTKRFPNGKEVNAEIVEDIQDILVKSIKKKGITEGFILKFDENDNYSDFIDDNINPENIRHVSGKSEKSFTSTGAKLKAHWPIFQKLNETGYGSIIRATLTLHQVCSSRCQFCSTINRNKKDSTTFEETKEFIEKLYYGQADYNKKHFSKYNEKYKNLSGTDIRLKGLILSGGGQPNLWPHFEKLVNWLSTLDIDIGLITNGFPKNIDDKIYDKFKWIRLSITPEDASPHYVDKKFNLQRIPKNIINNDKTFFGLSYVYGSWTNDDVLKRLSYSIENWKLDYIRMLTDCNLTRSEQLKSHNVLAEKLFKLSLIDKSGNNKGKIFHQLKFHGTQEEANKLWSDGKCFLQTYNLFWDTTGHETNGKSFCYPCDSVTVLAEENTRQQSKRGFDGNIWGTVTNDKVELLYEEKWKKFFDPRDHCSACLFMKNNRAVKDLINSREEELNDIKIDKDLEHINFP